MAMQVKSRMSLHVIYPWLYYRATRGWKWKHVGFIVKHHKLSKVYTAVVLCSVCVCLCGFAVAQKTVSVQVSAKNIPDNLNNSSEAILTDMSWEKRSFWGQANVSGRLLIGSLFSLAPKVLKASRWEAGGVSSAGGGSTSMGSAFTFTFWNWTSLLFCSVLFCSAETKSNYWLELQLMNIIWG